MTRHPTARRVHRTGAEPDDAFVAGVLETTAWAKQHQRALIIGGVAAAVIIIGLVLFLTNRAATRERAAAELTQVRAVALSGNNALAVRELEQYLARFGGTPTADEARLLLGRIYLAEGQTQQAVETVTSHARNVSTVTGVHAAFLEAAAHEATGDVQRAEALYLRVADGARFLYQRQEALDQAARLRLARGDAQGAAALYDRVLELTPDDDGSRAVYELRAGEARAAARSGSSRGDPAGD
jgi:tetratricopeptide (TPR) repeat protein